MCWKWRRRPMPRSSETVAVLASALSKAQAELINPEKSLTATIRTGRPGDGERSFRYAPLSSGLDIVRKTLGQHEIATLPFRLLLSHSARLPPEPAGNLDRVNAGLSPPRALVTGAMHRTMMPAAEWDRELIADLAAERTGLGETEVVRIRWLASAHKTRLLGD